MQITTVTAFVAAFFSAVLSALGMGGGSILLICLTALAGVDQLKAQGINLIFFLPTAIVAILLHIKHRYIKWKAALPLVLFGLAGVWFGARVAAVLDRELLSKAFGALLLVMGIREWRWTPVEKDREWDEKKR